MAVLWGLVVLGGELTGWQASGEAKGGGGGRLKS